MTKIIACLLLCSLTVTGKAAITMNPSHAFAYARDVDVGVTSQGFQSYTIPTHTVLTTGVGGSSSNNPIEWHMNGAQTILSLDMEHHRSGAANSYAQTEIFIWEFVANTYEPYELSGFYHVDDAGTNGQLHMNVLFHDPDSGAVFENNQFSNSTIDEHLTLGGTGGDNLNYLFGSLTGNLIAGHRYFLRTSAYIQAYPNADSGAIALGNITLKIGTVPEPSSLLLTGCVCFILSGRRLSK